MSAEVSAAVRATLAEVGLTVVDEHARELPIGPDTALVRFDVLSPVGAPGAVSARHSPHRLRHLITGLEAAGERAVVGTLWTSWFGASMALDEWSLAEVRPALVADLESLDARVGETPPTNADSRLVAAVLARPVVRDLVGERPRQVPAKALLMARGFEETTAEVLLAAETPRSRFELARPVLTALADGAPLEWVLRHHGGPA